MDNTIDLRKEALRARVSNDFTYHPPFGDQTDRYTVLRNGAKELAMIIIDLTPTSREQSIALTKLEEAVMFANAAIARNETPPTKETTNG